jgi:hypothetical protein
MAIKYPDDNTPMIPELIPNRDLIELRKTFGINPEFLLSDSNEYYTNMNDNMPIEKIDDGIASIDTGLPIYIPDGNNNFLQYSDEGAPAYIRDREPAAPINYQLQDPTIMKMANFDEMFGPKTFTDSMGNVRTVPGEERFTLPKEKTGILQSIKEGGSKLLDFIKGGGIVGNLIGDLLPKQSPEAIFMRDYYGGEDGSNLTSSGSIASGLMAGYNPVSGNNFLNRITGGFLPGQTYGLQNAYDKRIATIMKTLATKYKDGNYDDTLLDERLEKLREEKRKEKEAFNTSIARRQNPNVYREAENRGFTNDQGGFSTSKADKAGTSLGSGQFNPKTSQGRSGY